MQRERPLAGPVVPPAGDAPTRIAVANEGEVGGAIRDAPEGGLEGAAPFGRAAVERTGGSPTAEGPVPFGIDEVGPHRDAVPVKEAMERGGVGCRREQGSEEYPGAHDGEAYALVTRPVKSAGARAWA